MRNTDSSPVSLKHVASHRDFLKLLPAVERHARFAFRCYNEGEREEASAEAVAASYASYLTLKIRGRNALLFPSKMAAFAVMHVQNERRVGSRANSRDVFAKKTQRRRGFRVESFPEGNRDWSAVFADDSSPILDKVALRIDLPEFFQRLTLRERQMAQMLIEGWQANEVAKTFDISAPRMCQLRQKWHADWMRFHGE